MATGFHRRLNLFDSIAIVVGSMVGSGIFIVSADIARTLGSPGWLLVVWIVTGIFTVFAALSYGELASMFPDAGGQYVYLREIYNPLTAFLFGWTLFMVIQTGTIAAVAMAFGKFIGVIFPFFSEKNRLFQFKSFSLNSVQMIAIASILLLTFINSKGIEAGKWIQNAFSSSKVILLVLFITVGWLLARNPMAIEINSSYFWEPVVNKNGSWIQLNGFSLFSAFVVSMVGAIFSADAWFNITFTSAEVINPRRNVALSMALGTILVTILYVLANHVYLQCLPLRGNIDGISAFDRGMQFASDDRLATASVSGLLGNSAAWVMAIFIIISTIGCNNGIILSGARVYYAMAIDGLFFRSASRLNKQGVPAIGLYFQAAWAIVLCFSGSYNNLLDYVVIAVLLFYIISIAGIFILRVREPERPRPYKAWGFPFVPAIYILSALTIVLMLLIYKPGFTLPGLGIVLLGIPVFYLWKSVQKSPTNKPQAN
jgi:basic amino acid/polyamine antiporter, APA family